MSIINETFIIGESSGSSGSTPTITACTSVNTNQLISCSGDSRIILSTDSTIFNTSILPNQNISINLGSSDYNFRNLYTYNGFFSDVTTTGVTTNENIFINDKISSYSGLTDLSGKFLSGTTDGFILADISNIQNNSHVTDFLYSNNYFTIKQNGYPDLVTNFNSVTGLTINGNLNADTISATTYQNLPQDVYTTGLTFNTANNRLTEFLNNGTSFTANLTSLASDTFVTGGTYSNNNGIATFTNNTGGTFTITGFNTGNTYTTGLTFNNSTYVLTESLSDGSQLTANLAILSSDVTITGGTYNANTGVATFTNNSGATFQVSGFTTGLTDTSVTGFTYDSSNNQLELNQSNGNNFSTQITEVSGLTINGNLKYLDGNETLGNVLVSSLDGTAIWYNINLDFITTFGGNDINGGLNYIIPINSYGIQILDNNTLNNLVGIGNNGDGQGFIILSDISGNTQTTIENGIITSDFFIGDGSQLTDLPDVYSTGGTYSNGNLTINNNNNTNFSISGFSTGDTQFFVSGTGQNSIVQIASGGGTASGVNSVALNFDCSASGTNSFASGDGSIASGIASHSEGSSTASGNYSHASGRYSIASGDTSFVHGSGSTAAGTGTIVLGANIYGALSNTLYANAISATTYYNLPQDVFVTGGTYSNGTATFRNNTGNTFNIGGFFTGSTDVFSTGMTLNLSTYDLTITRNDGNSFSTNLGTLSSDVTITGGTYNINTGIVIFTNNTGGTFNVSGFTTGYTDTVISTFTYDDANRFTITDTSGGTFSVIANTFTGLTVNGSLSATTYYNLPQDVYVTGGTYSNGMTIFTNSTGGTFNISGFSQTQPFTGGTVNGATNFTNGLTANTISATTYYGNGSNLTGVAHGFTGTTTLDFGSPISGESSYTTTAVTNSNISQYSTVIIRFITSTNHPSIEDCILEEITVNQSDIVDGVGFNINAYANGGTWGIYNIIYRIIN